MTDINLAAIRKRDAEMEYWQVTGGSAVCTDRRVLLGYVDALVAAARAVSVACSLSRTFTTCSQAGAGVAIATRSRCARGTTGATCRTHHAP